MMNRLATTIRRPVRLPANPARPNSFSERERRAAPAADPFDNLRLFATGWAGGMIFFTTFFS
jgi:hypothetical protein